MTKESTLCYIEKDGKYLMLHRTVKENDVNKDKWIGVGGHFEYGESPEECLLREVKEENFIRLGNGWQLRGICDDFCRRAGIRPQAVFESNSPESVRNLIAAGLGIGFWPEKAWGGKPGHGVVLIPIRYPNCRRDLVVTVFEQAGNKPVVDEFVNYFCKYFEKDPSGMGDVTV